VCDAARRAGFVEPPRLTIEPGRSIIGPAGVAVYAVGSVKEITGVRTYVAIDGGMADNIRPTAYGAVYTPLLANRSWTTPGGRGGQVLRVGDVLVKEARRPAARGRPGGGAGVWRVPAGHGQQLQPLAAVAVVVVRDGCS
jgi:diaminopimelate decarboxylase